MAFEKNLLAIAPRLLTADGASDGKITVQDACDFKVKQRVKVSGTALDQLDLEVKRVISETEMYLGPVSGPISDRTDLSAYTTAAASFIYAVEQKRPSIPFEEFTRAVYEEEPTVAYRNVLVDKLGRFYATNNPLPVRLSDGSVNIGTVNAELEVQLSHIDNFPNIGDVADSVRVGDGTEIIQVNPDGSINVNITKTDPSGLTVNTYDDLTAVLSGAVSIIVTYTAPLATTTYLQHVHASGENIAIYSVKLNGNIIAQKRSYFGGSLNVDFDFRGDPGSNGLEIVPGDIVTVEVENFRPTVADFNARIVALEIV